MSISALNELLQVKNKCSPPLPERRLWYFLHVPDWGFRHRDMEQVFQGHTEILKVSFSFLLSKPTIFLGDHSNPSLEDVLSLQTQRVKLSEWKWLGTEAHSSRLFLHWKYSIDCCLWIPTQLLQQPMKLNMLSWLRKKKKKPTAATSREKNNNKPGTHFLDSCNYPRHKKRNFSCPG